MKKWLILIAVLTAAGTLARLPHPARDIAKLEPVRAVHLFVEDAAITIRTDTGDTGTGVDLIRAYAALRAGADGEIFLDTAEFLILDPDAPTPEALWEIFRPGCKVLITKERPDLKKAPADLAQHPPQKTLAHLRAAQP